jgi:CheY-like chemotaxis protein
MSLILAIEPNKNQAHQLSTLVRTHLKAELVTAPTAAAALTALGDRIPDVVLTPALFGLKDEAALTERLRQLGTDGSHVQTLAIPILASGASRGNGTLLGRKKDKGDEVGCDPAVFAEQIRIYLQRAAVERRAQASEAAARAMTTGAGPSDAAPPEDLPSFILDADELDVDSLELPTIPPPAPPAPAPPPPAAAAAAQVAAKPKQQSALAAAVEEELGLVTPPAAGPPLWRVTESIEDFYKNPESFEAPAAGTSMDSGIPAPTAAKPVGHGVSAASTAPRSRRTPPQPDDWAYFDPSQSAFKALIRRLDEIAGAP